ncbi:hypothetical protein ACOTVP_08620 [Aliarcobacter butzleri]
MIVINNEKAIEISKDKIRVWRDSEFKKNDIAIQNALVDGSDTTELIAKRDYLRDLPAICDGKSIGELKEILSEIGIV